MQLNRVIFPKCLAGCTEEGMSLGVGGFVF